MIGGWLLKAIELNMDLSNLFESRLFTSKLNKLDKKLFTSFKSWPEHHKDSKSVTVKFDGHLPELFHNNNVYGRYFGSLTQETGNEVPILYQISYLKLTVDEQASFMKLLSKTSNMSYF